MERSRTPSVISVASLAPSQRSTVSPTGNLHGWQAGRHSGVAGPCKLQCLQRAPCCLQGRMKQLLEQRECAHPTRRSVLWNALSCTRASQLGHRRVGLYPAHSSSAEGSATVKADPPAPQELRVHEELLSLLSNGPRTSVHGRTREGAARGVLAPPSGGLHLAAMPADTCRESMAAR